MHASNSYNQSACTTHTHTMRKQASLHLPNPLELWPELQRLVTAVLSPSSLPLKCMALIESRAAILRLLSVFLAPKEAICFGFWFPPPSLSFSFPLSTLWRGTESESLHTAGSGECGACGHLSTFLFLSLFCALDPFIVGLLRTGQFLLGIHFSWFCSSCSLVSYFLLCFCFTASWMAVYSI